jgi:hypothetical protein
MDDNAKPSERAAKTRKNQPEPAVPDESSEPSVAGETIAGSDQPLTEPSGPQEEPKVELTAAPSIQEDPKIEVTAAPSIEASVDRQQTVSSPASQSETSQGPSRSRAQRVRYRRNPYRR